MKQNPHIGPYPILEFYCERKNRRFKWKRFIRAAGNNGKDVWQEPWKRVPERTWKDLTEYRRELVKADKVYGP